MISQNVSVGGHEDRNEVDKPEPVNFSSFPGSGDRRIPCLREPTLNVGKTVCLDESFEILTTVFPRLGLCIRTSSRHICIDHEMCGEGEE